MVSICVVFAVGDDIVQKLKSLPVKERKDFVLGYTDNDYFGSHILAIEELDDQWNMVFQFLKEDKEYGIDFMRNGENLNEADDDCMYLLVHKSYIETAFDQLEMWNPVSIARKYLELVQHNHETLSFSDVTYYLDVLKRICIEALKAHGTILFSLEPY